MRKFLARFDRLVDKLIDVDSMIPEGTLKPVPIKVIFDNLRYYTVLAFLWIGVKVLMKDGSTSSTFAGLVLGAVTLTLALLVFAQSAYIMLAATVGNAGALLHPRTAVRLRRRLRGNDRAVKVIVLLLVIPVMAGAVLLSTALLASLSRAGAL